MEERSNCDRSIASKWIEMRSVDRSWPERMQTIGTTLVNLFGRICNDLGWCSNRGDEEKNFDLSG
jgi:hypothetical protein